ncbi:unnamed protein product [Sphagnum balticum]
MLSTEQQEKAIGGLLKRKENIYCADCNDATGEFVAQPVLGGEIGWGRSNEVPFVPLSKPNVNTPLPEIIKFVHDKYVKRKYTDLDAPADPLSLHKQGLAPFRPKVAPKL